MSSGDGRRAPPISIGLPVYNGERFLARAVQSILEQEYGDFELVISDNGSTDTTPEIGRHFAAHDDRVTYLRHETNRGAAWNFNHVVAVTSGPLFKWAAHDDELRPAWLGRCVAALAEAPTAALAYTRRVKIDADGNLVKVTRSRPKAFLNPAAGPAERFTDVLARTTSCIESFGLIRRATLGRTRLLQRYPASDRILLAELALLGHFAEVPEELFLHREHEDRSIRRYRTASASAAWFEPGRGAHPALPTWRLGWEYARAVNRAGLPASERLRAYQGVAGWVARRRRLMADNVVDAVRTKAGQWRQPIRA
ncbi:MAG: glycosyltransferase family 2 protein [Acidimicrobiales bacterium]